jgi:hypothetical protein
MDRLQGPSSKEPKSLLIWWKVFLIGFFSWNLALFLIFFYLFF